MIKTCSYVSRSYLTIHEGCSFPIIEFFDISGCNQAKMVPAFQKFLLVSMLVKTVPTFVIGFTCSLLRWSWSTLHLGALPCQHGQQSLLWSPLTCQHKTSVVWLFDYIKNSQFQCLNYFRIQELRDLVFGKSESENRHSQLFQNL
jgi:hypothetical protein